MKKVLIVTYYWPPSGGISVQRIVKFAKYLPSLGWTPIILTVDKDNYFQVDNSYLKDTIHLNNIYRAKSIEPHFLYNAIKPSNKTGDDNIDRTRKYSLFAKGIDWLADFVRLNFFIPDARIGWYPKAVRMGLNIIREEKPDLILSTAPPFTTHLVAKRLCLKTGLPWVADFRDAWLENNLYHKPYRLLPARLINQFLEKSVITHASKIVCIGKNMRRLLASKISGSHKNKFHVISNGYDPEDVKTYSNNSDLFYLSYFGTIYKERLSSSFLNALKQAIEDHKEFGEIFRLRIFGNVDQAGLEILHEYIPANNLEIRKPLTYEKFMQELHTPQLLLLTIDDVPFNELIVTGKLFDYLTSANPILGLGPVDGDAAEILTETNYGAMFYYNDPLATTYIMDKYALWKQGKIKISKRNLNHLERKHLTEELVKVLDDTCTTQIKTYNLD